MSRLSSTTEGGACVSCADAEPEPTITPHNSASAVRDETQSPLVRGRAVVLICDADWKDAARRRRNEGLNCITRDPAPTGIMSVVPDVSIYRNTAQNGCNQSVGCYTNLSGPEPGC